MDIKEISKTINNKLKLYFKSLPNDKDFKISMKLGSGKNAHLEYQSVLFAYNSTIPLVWIANYIKANMSIVDYAKIADRKDGIVHKIDDLYIFNILSENLTNGMTTSLLQHYYKEFRDNETLKVYIASGYKQEFGKKLRDLNDVAIYQFAQFYKDVNDIQFNSLGIDGLSYFENPNDIGYNLSKCNLDMLKEDNKKAIELCHMLLPSSSSEIFAAINKLFDGQSIEAIPNIGEHPEIKSCPIDIKKTTEPIASEKELDCFEKMLKKQSNGNDTNIKIIRNYIENEESLIGQSFARFVFALILLGWVKSGYKAKPIYRIMIEYFNFKGGTYVSFNTEWKIIRDNILQLYDEKGDRKDGAVIDGKNNTICIEIDRIKGNLLEMKRGR